MNSTSKTITIIPAATPAPPITNATLTIEAADGGVKSTSKGERVDGSKIDIAATTKYDGKEYPVMGTGFRLIPAR